MCLIYQIISKNILIDYIATVKAHGAEPYGWMFLRTQNGTSRGFIDSKNIHKIIVLEIENHPNKLRNVFNIIDR